ncbi:50S ribosomal protein L18 [Candidatus Purcelliella pentastirinorum]|uniref:Large ribosomal subunit protein uL18 n=1 Tax=Candidatus Purcelliella pentastirinorum TaxID=472834 RepID=A0A346DZL4_9ENTR|nr:50S ribosomal protein L18 [Candidatus Purcelliella pentastirinorum]AXN02169.1 LSU ribosomal protein L18p (L5e) [Candidatus Purcelliella pentastirinorum]WDI79120.1 50S ribosomal protein L18 [Candidatus Purcelliella pentastirinorum]WDR80259.1 50S ribosomal protein L18 [Candidatus Purcelliella pentastirinorum]
MNKKKSRLIRASRIRHKFKKGNVFRLVIHRSYRHIYAQIISSDNCNVLASASTVENEIFKLIKYSGNISAAIIVGRKIAERSLNKGIIKVSFDRSGFKYHGRIKALADAAREFGLKF